MFGDSERAPRVRAALGEKRLAVHQDAQFPLTIVLILILELVLFFIGVMR